MGSPGPLFTAPAISACPWYARLGTMKRATTLGLVLAVACGGDGSVGDGSSSSSNGSSSSSSGTTTSTSGGGGSGGQSSGGGGTSGGGSGGAELPSCQVLDGSFSSIGGAGPPTDQPAISHPDLNMAVRGWEPTGGTLGLVDINGPTDPLAPRLNRLFPDDRIPTFAANYAVYQWDWNNSQKGPLITDPEVTLAGFVTTPGEIIELPTSGYEVAPGIGARVLLATEESITLKYTAEDNVVWGYTIHMEGVCVAPALLSLYLANDAAGRIELPALSPEQAFARARGHEIQVAIRDTGAYMDPRSSKDWWP